MKNGYMHYFYIKKSVNKKKYLEALSKIRLFLIPFQESLVEFESKGGIFFSRESEKLGRFYLPENFNDLHSSKNSYFGFCETNKEKYDVVVVSCLVILKVILKDDVTLRSDGRLDDLTEGIIVALNFLMFNDVKFDIEDCDDMPRMQLIYQYLFQSGSE